MQVRGRGVGSCFGCDEGDGWLTLVSSGGAQCVVHGGSTVVTSSVVYKEDLRSRWWFCTMVYGGGCV